MTVTSLSSETPTLIGRLRATRLPPPAERRSLREAAGATLQDVADELGVSTASVSCWELGKHKPGPRNLAAYLELLQGFAVLARESSATQSQK